MASAWRYLSLCAFGAALAPEGADASAWRAPVEGSSIVTAVYGARGEAAISESGVYMENRLWRRWDGVFSGQVDTFDQLGPADEHGVSVRELGWRGEATAALKTTLVEGRNHVVSGQGGLTYTEGSAEPCGVGGEARILGGLSQAVWFADAQAAYRVNEGGCRSGKIDITAGVRAGESWIGLGQTFIDVAAGADPVIKLQFSVVRQSRRGEGLQVGVRIRADEAGADEHALVVGWWKALTKAYQPRID